VLARATHLYADIAHNISVVPLHQSTTLASVRGRSEANLIVN